MSSDDDTKRRNKTRPSARRKSTDASTGSDSSDKPASRSRKGKAPSARARKSSEPPKPAARASRRKPDAGNGKAEARSSKKRARARTTARRASTPQRTGGGDAQQGSVLITGICGRMGQLLARRLHRSGTVIGVDRRAFVGKPKDIVHYEVDLRRKKTRDIFRKHDIRAVVHLGVMHDPRASDKEHHTWNVVAFQKLLDSLQQYDVPKLVVLSSANVYGPQPDNPQFLTEDAPLLGAQTFRSIRDLVELDMLAQGFFWKHPETETVILRPCHILGRVHNAPSNYLRLDRPMTILGFDPMVQVVHEQDVVEAVMRALEPGVRGIFNVRGPGELPLSRILRILGRQPRSVPAPVAHAALDRLWKYRLTSFPPPELDHIRYVCMVDDSRARTELGYEPRHDLEDTVRAVTSDR